MTSAFLLRPHDVLFFRDGKPSSLGEDHSHRSIFPPHSSTLYGAIRTRRLVDAGVDLSKLTPTTWDGDVHADLQAEIGTPRTLGTLALRGPWLTRQQREGDAPEILLPAPSDLGIVEAREDSGRRTVVTVVRYRAAGSAERAWSHGLALLQPFRRSSGQWELLAGARDADDVTDSRGWFLRPPGMDRWLDGGLPEPDDFVHASELWFEEARTGVGLNDQGRTAEKSRLYTFAFIRLERGVDLGFETEGSALEAGGTIALGGEGRAGDLLRGPRLGAASRSTGDRFTLYLATPAIFDNGSIPDSIDTQTLRGVIGGVACRLVAAACGRFDLIGGWDLANCRSRPLRRAVPAGTVFVFERIAKAGAAADRAFMDADLLKQGFGFSLTGVST